MEKSAILSIQLLGDFSLVYGDVPLRTVSTARLKSLLAYLLLHRNVPLSRHQLAFLFWPDSSEAQAHNNLRQSIHRLRHALPDVECFLDCDVHTIQWRPGSSFVLDVAEFEKAVDAASSIDSLREAVTLYQGDLLRDCYDDWILIERERLQQKFHTILEHLIHSLEELGDYRSAIHFAERLLRDDPLKEETYQELIRLNAVSGNRTGAMRAYHTCARVLKHELDVEPGLETRIVFEDSQKTRGLPVFVDLPQKRKNNLQPFSTPIYV